MEKRNTTTKERNGKGRAVHLFQDTEFGERLLSSQARGVPANTEVPPVAWIGGVMCDFAETKDSAKLFENPLKLGGV